MSLTLVQTSALGLGSAPFGRRKSSNRYLPQLPGSKVSSKYAPGHLIPLRRSDPTRTGNHRFSPGNGVSSRGLFQGARSRRRSGAVQHGESKRGPTSAPVEPQSGEAKQAAEIAHLRSRAQRFRGGRMGGGTRGWNWGEKGDSDGDGDEKLKAPTKDPRIVRKLAPVDSSVILIPNNQSSRQIWKYEVEDADQAFWNAVREMYPKRDWDAVCLVFDEHTHNGMLLKSYDETIGVDQPIPLQKIRERHGEIKPEWTIVPCFGKIRFLHPSGKSIAPKRRSCTMSPSPVERPGIARDVNLKQLGKKVKVILNEIVPSKADGPPQILELHDENSRDLICDYHPADDPARLAADFFWKLSSSKIMVKLKAGSGMLGASDGIERSPKLDPRAGDPQPQGTAYDEESEHYLQTELNQTRQELYSLQRNQRHFEQVLGEANENQRQLYARNLQVETENVELKKEIENLKHDRDHQSQLLASALMVLKEFEEEIAKLKDQRERPSQERPAALEPAYEPERPITPTEDASKVQAAAKPTRKSANTKSSAAQKTARAESDPMQETPQPLPQDIPVPATRQEMYDSVQYSNATLQPLFKAGFRVCNVCLAWCKGYSGYSDHARQCNTCPWNFVTSADKKGLAKGKTGFAHRFARPNQTTSAASAARSKSNDQSTDTIELAAPSPGHGKRKRETNSGSSSQRTPAKKRKDSQQAYKDDGGNEEDEADDAVEQAVQPESRSRKRRRDSQAPYRDSNEAEEDVRRKKKSKRQ